MTIPAIPACVPYDEVALLRLIAVLLGTGGFGTLSGNGSPEGVVTANVGTIYIDKSNTTNPGVWVKTSGTGNTGWADVIAAGP